MAEPNGTPGQSFLRWICSQILSTSFFKNTITLMIVCVYCILMVMGRTPDSQFGLLVGMILGFYFKRGEKD